MQEEINYSPETHPVIAIDLDGTIWDEDYPNTAIPYFKSIETINKMVEIGYEVIIFTARGEENLKACKWFLIDEIGLNPNVKFNQHSNYYTSLYPISSPKINASVYFEDKAFNAPNYKTEWPNIYNKFCKGK
jgi:hypothetical protein